MRRLPRQSGKLLGLLGAGVGADLKWRDVHPRYRTYFDKQLQAVVTTDLSEWGGRSCYYWGRYYDVVHQALLRRILRLGDTYIDIGANLGFHSLFARKLIGPGGTLVSFEPHPRTFALLSAHFAINRIWGTHLFNLALGSEPGTATLHQPEEHSGTSTLRECATSVFSVSVPVETGDRVLEKVPFTGRVVVKIDVEGLESAVLRGIEKTLERVSMVAMEVTPGWLIRQGGSVEELYRYMAGLGFRPIVPSISWKLGLFPGELRFLPAEQVEEWQYDVCFVRDSLAAEANLVVTA